MIANHPKLEYEDNTVMNSRLLVLSHTFRYPHQIPDLLLPQPHVSKENTIMELQLREGNRYFIVSENEDHSQSTEIYNVTLFRSKIIDVVRSSHAPVLTTI